MITPRYSWKEFNDSVRTLLTVDKDRLGMQDTTTAEGQTVPGYLTLQIRQAVLDLQDFIPAFRVGHETIYHPEDFAPDGLASRGVLPPQAQLQDVWLYQAASKVRYPVTGFPWERRFELINGLVNLMDNNGRMAIDPQAYTFYVYPAVTDNWVLSVFWDGKKSTFSDCERTPFTEEATLAVAEFVKGKLAREVDQDLVKYDSYFHPVRGSYVVARKNLFLSTRAKSL